MERDVTNLGKLVCALLLVSMLCACVSDKGQAQPEPQNVDQALGLIPAPPAGPLREISFDPDNLSIPGGEHSTELPTSRVSVEHNETIFAPDWQQGSAFSGIAFCMYPILIEDYAGEASIDFVWGGQQPSGNTYWLGLARPDLQRWQWFAQPGDGRLELESFADFLYDDGTVLLAVVVLGNVQQRLYSMQVGPYPEPELPVETITVPEGFSVSVFAYPVPNARAMARGPGDTVFVGSRSAGVVYAISDYNTDYIADQIRVVASSMNEPVGVDIHQGDLYYSAISEIWRIDDIEQNLDGPFNPQLVTDSFPTEQHHGWKFIRFGPDDKLYVPVGAPCNICDAGDPYSAIHRMNPDGSDIELIARGVRNTVGFDWHPLTGELWFTDNGGDNLGDDIPPCELNNIDSAAGGIPHFGYPYFHGESFPDPNFSDGHNAEDYIEPVQALGPHVAPLGMRFYEGEMFPGEYHGDVFIAEHGSWNRSTPIGYRVTRVELDEAGGSLGYSVFASGWQDPEDPHSQWGRPVDVLIMPDGSMLVSDDQAGAIYRIAYGE